MTPRTILIAVMSTQAMPRRGKIVPCETLVEEPPPLPYRRRSKGFDAKFAAAAAAADLMHFSTTDDGKLGMFCGTIRSLCQTDPRARRLRRRL
jgi:hypothetical protein